MVPAKDLEFRDESVILVHRLYGAIIATIRKSLEVSQQGLAEATNMPPSTISKLENGSIVVGIYHLDVLAGAFNQLGTDILGRDPAWRGWELHKLADDISTSIERDGFVAMWASPTADGKEMVPERKLAALVRAYWPDAAKRRIGW
jgi:transcriptional regulator with XRE-family HTH domain